MPYRPVRRPLVVVLALVLAGTVATFLEPMPAAAGETETMEAAVVSWINRDRARKGLQTLVVDGRLVDLAGHRADRLAAHGALSHSAAGNLTSQLDGREISRVGHGETIGYSTVAWGMASAAAIHELWTASTSHWGILTGARFTHVGVGLSRASDGTTFASAILIEVAGSAHAPARPASATTVRPRSTPRVVVANPRPETAGLRDFGLRHGPGGRQWSALREYRLERTLPPIAAVAHEVLAIGWSRFGRSWSTLRWQTNPGLRGS